MKKHNEESIYETEHKLDHEVAGIRLSAVIMPHGG